MSAERQVNDTAVYHALKWDSQHGDNVWVVGKIGTREAVIKAGLKPDEAYVLWCPHEWLENGWVKFGR